MIPNTTADFLKSGFNTVMMRMVTLILFLVKVFGAMKTREVTGDQY